jgi:hypothetical protein
MTKTATRTVRATALRTGDVLASTGETLYEVWNDTDGVWIETDSIVGYVDRREQFRIVDFGDR